MLLSPLSQPVVRALYNGASNRVARDTPSSAWYVIRHIHSNESCYYIQIFLAYFFVIKLLVKSLIIRKDDESKKSSSKNHNIYFSSRTKIRGGGDFYIIWYKLPLYSFKIPILYGRNTSNFVIFNFCHGQKKGGRVFYIILHKHYASFLLLQNSHTSDRNTIYHPELLFWHTSGTEVTKWNFSRSRWGGGYIGQIRWGGDI